MDKYFKNSTVKIDNEEKMAGKALFTDDIPLEGALYCRPLRSSICRGRVRFVNLPTLPKGYYYIDAKNIRKENIVNTVVSDQPVFADGYVNFYGETIGLLVGEDKEQLELIAHDIEVMYDEETPVFDYVNSKVHKHFKKGDIDAIKAESDMVFEEIFETGYQEQVYLETQGMIMYFEGEQLVIKASMQCPFYIKKSVMRCTGLNEEQVRVIQPAVGGAFGGKEHYPSMMACQMATAILKIRKPLKMVFDRSEDLIYTTKRHPSLSKYTGYVKNNKLIGVKAEIKLNGGAYVTCSNVVLSRGLIAAVNCYNIPNTDITGDVYVTNTMPTAAFRGFGSPQTIFAFEMFMKHIADKLGIDVSEFKRQHMVEKGDITSTNGVFRDDIILPELIDKAFEMSDYRKKVIEYSKPDSNKGIGMSIFLHGCGFTGAGESTIINAKVRLIKDENDIVHLFTSQVDFGQGNRTTLKKIVSNTLNVPEEQVTHEPPDTDHTLSTGPTAASRTLIIVGFLCEKAAKNLLKIWKPGDRQEVIEPYVGPSYIHWDEDTMQGDAYPGYAWGCNVVEVEFDPITYQVKVTGAWSTYDVGHAIDDRIVVGQADGGLVQGLGYGYMEKLNMVAGKFTQKALSDYIIPTTVDMPNLETELIDNLFAYGASGAKGCGELTLVGGAPAICSAIEMAAKVKINKIPATPEYLMELVEHGKN